MAKTRESSSAKNNQKKTKKRGPSVKKIELPGKEREDLLDLANEETFPASDPPPTSPQTSLGKHGESKVKRP